jgi:hypothetical protein
VVWRRALHTLDLCLASSQGASKYSANRKEACGAEKGLRSGVRPGIQPPGLNITNCSSPVEKHGERKGLPARFRNYTCIRMSIHEHLPPQGRKELKEVG